MKTAKPLFLVLAILLVTSCSNKETKKAVFQPDDVKGKDVVISEGYPKRNYSKQDQLWMLSSTLKDTIDNDRRFLLRFGFSTLPEGTKVDSAFIHLKAAGKGHFGKENSFLVERITNVWINKDVNWNTHPKSDESTGLVIEAPKEKMQDYKIDVTAFVNGVLNKEYDNYGFLFKLKKEDKPHKGLRFHSSNTLEKENRPKLEVFFKE